MSSLTDARKRKRSLTGKSMRKKTSAPRVTRIAIVTEVESETRTAKRSELTQKAKVQAAGKVSVLLLLSSQWT